MMKLVSIVLREFPASYGAFVESLYLIVETRRLDFDKVSSLLLQKETVVRIAHPSPSWTGTPPVCAFLSCPEIWLSLEFPDPEIWLTLKTEETSKN